jgi:alpha-mannosidase
MRPVVVVVSHTHWDREWHQPFEVFRLRLCRVVEELLQILDGGAFAHFMLDGQTICVEDVLEVRPELEEPLRAHLRAGRLSIGPWYVLQDEFLVGAEAIVRNLAEGQKSARRFGRPMAIGYLPDAFGHIAQMPRILGGFGIETAVVWRGVGDAAPGSEWRWRSPGGAEVLCLFLPGGYGNAHRPSREQLRDDLARVLPLSRAGLLLWMNGNDHQPAQPGLPALLDELRQDVDIEHASLERAAEIVRAQIDPAALPFVEGELRRGTPSAPVLSGTWSARSWQKRDHDRAQALLARFAEPFVAFAGLDRRGALGHAWRLLLQCQPHDSICGCSIDEVHREIDGRLRRLSQLGRTLLGEAVQSLSGAPTADFALHHAVAVVNPHPFAVSGTAEVEVQRPLGPFRLVGPDGEVAYQVVSRTPTDGPDGRPAEWLRLRIQVRDLPPHGLRMLAIEPGTPASTSAHTTLEVREIPGGLEIAGEGVRVRHGFEDQPDRGDLYDFCPAGEPRAFEGAEVRWSAVGRRVDVEVTIDNRTPDHRLRARFELTPPPGSIRTDTPFAWLSRTEPGTHPVSTITAAPGFAAGGDGLHEVERAADGAILLTLFRAVGWMSRGDLSTRPGHAGYNVPTPDAQGIGRLQFRYSIALGADAVREVEAGLLPPQAVALAQATPSDRPLLSVDGARLSIFKRADDGDGYILRLWGGAARIRLYRPFRAWESDLDERIGAEIKVAGDELAVAADDVATLRIRFL